MKNVFKVVAEPFTALSGHIDDAVRRKVMMSIARKAAMVLATWLVSQGYLESNHVAEFAGYFVGLVSLFSGWQNAVNHG